MKINRHEFLVVMWVFCLLQIPVAAQTGSSAANYSLRNFTPANGLGATQVRGIIQDSLGYIWIGSGLGLSRWDGYNFKTYEFDPDGALSSSFQGGIRYFVLDHHGEVWIASDVISKYDRNTDKIIHYGPELDPKKVFRFEFDKKNPVIWMGTHMEGLYSFNFETNITSNYFRRDSDSLTQAKINSVWGIIDRDSVLLLSTRNGVWNFSKSTKKFGRPKCDPTDSSFLFNTAIWHMFVCDPPRETETWLALENGLVKVDEDLSVIQRFEFPNGFRSTMYRLDKNGFFWFISLDGKLYRYDPFRDFFEPIEINTGGQPFTFQNSLFVDREGCIWSGSEADGAYQLIPNTLVFHNLNFPARGSWATSTLYKSDKRETLFLVKGMGGLGNEIWTANPILPDVHSVGFKKLDVKLPVDGTIMSLASGKKNLWICSYSGGVAGLPMDSRTGEIEEEKGFRLAEDLRNPNTIRYANNAWVHEDPDENLWIVSRGFGITKVVSSKPYGTEGSVIRYQHSKQDTNSLGYDYSLRIFPEDDKSFWALTWKGADLFRNGTFSHEFKDRGTPRSLIKTEPGSVVIGTLSGVYRGVRVNGRYQFNAIARLENYHVDHMLEDDSRRLWMTHPLSNKLILYDPIRDLTIEYNEDDGLPTGANTFHKTSKGLMILSSINGFTIFNPLSVQIDTRKPVPVLTALRVNNETPKISADGTNTKGFIDADISMLQALTLSHDLNEFTVEFSAMMHTSPEKNMYRYKLEGFDDTWIETDSRNRTATYTNLDAGTYFFKVVASNHHGIWGDQERLLTITVLPPPWKTWWAYTLYVLFFAGILIFWRRYDIKRVKLKHRAEYLTEIDLLKTRFFANISHEFRTPITLILGPLKKLIDNASNDEEKETLGIMMRNGQRLLRLINQLLDLSKIEAGKMELRSSRIDLVGFLREIAASYESLAADKKLRYMFYAEQTELYACIDPEKLEKVIHNLLSNAFKFTSKGEIILYLKAEEKTCVITLKDTGIGIPSDQLNKVFDRFYQVDSSQTRGYEGSGLGMALAKDLIELHQGKISAESTEGKGSVFKVVLPLGEELSHGEEIEQPTYVRESDNLSQSFVSSESSPTEKGVSPTGRAVVLVVEDNPDMRNYIRKALSELYSVMESENGKMGFDIALESIPDLIISDIMMPEMDGFKLCSLVKTHELTSHIPVILLTAKADRDSKLSGLETGADDYLTKPFDADELKLIVRNRIEERRKMRDKFSRQITLEPKEIPITSLDEKFLEKVLAIIERHMDDEHFSVEEMSREAGFSNMQFYRKIKGLSDQTPSQFLRTIRLKRAAALLAANSDNVTQIAYSVGFSSLSYFNKCFKEQFGVTPGQYAPEKK